MRMIRVEDAPVVRKTEGFEGRKLSDGPAATIVHIRMEAGTELEPHPAPADTAFFIARGSCTFTSDGVRTRAEAGCAIEVDKGSVNGFLVDAEGPLVLLAIRAGA